MIHLIYICLILNALVTGYYVNEGSLSDYSSKGKIFLISYWILLIGIGSILFLIQLCINLFRFIIGSINKYFQISFYYKFYLTKQFDAIESYQIERMNNITKNHHQSQSITDKIWRHQMRLINEKYL